MANDNDLTPLFVRLTKSDAERLERAAFEGRTSKRELVTDALRAHLGGDQPTPAPAPTPAPLELGRHEFRPVGASLPDVLTLAQAAALLQVDQAALAELADGGEVPGRRIAGEWRFARSALVDWLASAG